MYKLITTLLFLTFFANTSPGAALSSTCPPSGCNHPPASFLSTHNSFPIINPVPTTLATSVSVTTTGSVFVTSKIAPTSTTPVTSAVASKAAVADCNYEGLPSATMVQYVITGSYAPDALSCQTACEGNDECLSYSYSVPANTFFDNCQLYRFRFNGVDFTGAPLVIKWLVANTYWSNRFPSDGSGFCYGS